MGGLSVIPDEIGDHLLDSFPPNLSPPTVGINAYSQNLPTVSILKHSLHHAALIIIYLTPFSADFLNKNYDNTKTKSIEKNNRI